MSHAAARLLGRAITDCRKRLVRCPGQKCIDKSRVGPTRFGNDRDTPLDREESGRAALLPGAVERNAVSGFGLCGNCRVADESGKDGDGLRGRIALNVRRRSSLRK
jgi:hypothetical protein